MMEGLDKGVHATPEQEESERRRRIKLEKREKELLTQLKEEETLRASLEKQQKEMRDRLEELKSSLKQEKVLRNKEELCRASIESEFRKYRDSLEETVWTRSGLEEDIMKLEKEAFFLRKQLDEINDARAATNMLEAKLLPSEAEAEQKIAARKELENIVKRLESQLEIQKKRLEQQSLARGAITNELEMKKSVLRRKLKTKSDIERVLMEIEDDMAALKKKFKEEVKSKEQLEWMLNIEMQDMNRRLTIESHAREKLKNSLEQAFSVRQSLLGDVERIKSKVFEAKKEALGGNSKSSDRPIEKETGYSAPEIFAVVQGLEKELEAMNDILIVDDVAENAKEVARMVQELKKKVDEGEGVRLELIGQNERLVGDVNDIKKSLEEERDHRKKMEEALNEEREKRAQLEKKILELLEKNK